MLERLAQTQQSNVNRKIQIFLKKKKITKSDLPDDFYDWPELEQRNWIKTYKKPKKEKKIGLDWQNVFKRVWLDEDKRQQTLERLVARNPQEEKALNLVFSLKDFFYSQSLLDRSRKLNHGVFDQEEIKREVLTCTKWYYQASNFLIENKGNKNKIKDFWLKVRQIIFTNIEISNSQRKQEMFESLRQAVASQVASFYIFKELNESVSLSSPEEDAFQESDLQIKDIVSELSGKGLKSKVRRILNLQVKRVRGESFDPLLVETASLTTEVINSKFPTEAVDYFISLTTPSRKKQFSVKCQDLAEKKGKPVKGLYLFLPEKAYDANTGKPNKKVIAEIYKQFEKISK